MNFIEEVIMNMEGAQRITLRSKCGLFEALLNPTGGFKQVPQTRITRRGNGNPYSSMMRISVDNYPRTTCGLLHELGRNRFKSVIRVSDAEHTHSFDYVRHTITSKYKTIQEDTKRIKNMYDEAEMFQLNTLYDLPEETIFGMDKVLEKLKTLTLTQPYAIMGNWNLIEYLTGEYDDSCPQYSIGQW